MGRRGRPAKVQAVPRKPSVHSCSSREPSSSPERHLFNAVEGAKASMAYSSSSQPAVGLSWVSVLKSAGKQTPDTGPLPVSLSIAPPTPYPLISPATVPTVQATSTVVNHASSPVPSVAPVQPLSVPSGMASPSRKIAKVLKSEIAEEVLYWESSVVCYITNANPPLSVIDKFLRRVWKTLDIDKIGMVNRGVFLVRFKSKEDQDMACSMNGFLFDRKPLIVKPWHPSISYEKSSITAVPVWVKLPKLALVYWHANTLRNIASYLGNVLKIDNATLTKSRMMYARVLVEMNVAEGFPAELFFSNENDELISQPVQYEWVPVWCTKCSQFGHIASDCRMGQPRPSKTRLEVDDNGFRRFRKPFQERIGDTGVSLPGNVVVPSRVPSPTPLELVTGSEPVVDQSHSSVALPVSGDGSLDAFPCVGGTSSSVTFNVPAASVTNSFDVLSQLPSDLESHLPINTALGADPIPGND